MSNNLKYDEIKYWKFKKIEGRVAYAVSNGIDPETNLSSCTVYDEVGNKDSFDLRIGEIEEYLTANNDTTNGTEYYIRVGKQYVVNADSIVRISTSQRLLTLAFNIKKKLHIDIKDIPEEALRDLQRTMKGLQAAQKPPFCNKICFCTDSNGYWFYPQEVLYVISDPGTKRCFVRCANGDIYYIPSRLGDADWKLNGFSNKRALNEHISKTCIIQVNRLDTTNSSPQAIYMLDANDDPIKVTDFSYYRTDSGKEYIKEEDLAKSICGKYYNEYIKDSANYAQAKSKARPFFNFEIGRSLSFMRVEARNETNSNLGFVIIGEE